MSTISSCRSKKCSLIIYILHQHPVVLENILYQLQKYVKEFKLKPKKSYIIDIGSNDGVALKPFKDLGFRNILGIEPAKNLAKLANKNKIKLLMVF